MSILTVTAKGQVTLRRDLLQHLGVHPGEQIMVDKLPDGRILQASRPAGNIARLQHVEAGGIAILISR